MSNSVEIRISERGPFAGDHAFGTSGAYERLVGRAHFAVDPRAEAQAGIVDLDKAPTNADGRVEFAADLCILKPAHMERGNARLLFGYGMDVMLRQPRQQARAAIFQRCAGEQRPADTGRRRQRLSHAPWLCRRLGRLGR